MRKWRGLSVSQFLALGGLGFEERCSHQCRRSLGPHDPSASSCCGHQNCACSGSGVRFTSVGRSQTCSSGAGEGWWICGAVLARIDSRATPSSREPEFHEPGGPRAGWQHEAANRVERQFRTTSVSPLLSPSRRAMLRSKSGPAAGVVLCFTPSSLDAFPARFVPCPSAALCSSLTFDFAQLPVWFWPPPGSVL